MGCAAVLRLLLGSVWTSALLLTAEYPQVNPVLQAKVFPLLPPGVGGQGPLLPPGVGAEGPRENPVLQSKLIPMLPPGVAAAEEPRGNAVLQTKLVPQLPPGIGGGAAMIPSNQVGPSRIPAVVGNSGAISDKNPDEALKLQQLWQSLFRKPVTNGLLGSGSHSVYGSWKPWESSGQSEHAPGSHTGYPASAAGRPSQWSEHSSYEPGLGYPNVPVTPAPRPSHRLELSIKYEHPKKQTSDNTRSPLQSSLGSSMHQSWGSRHPSYSSSHPPNPLDLTNHVDSNFRLQPWWPQQPGPHREPHSAHLASSQTMEQSHPNSAAASGHQGWYNWQPFSVGHNEGPSPGAPETHLPFTSGLESNGDTVWGSDQLGGPHAPNTGQSEYSHYYQPTNPLRPSEQEQSAQVSSLNLENPDLQTSNVENVWHQAWSSSPDQPPMFSETFQFVPQTEQQVPRESSSQASNPIDTSHEVSQWPNAWSARYPSVPQFKPVNIEGQPSSPQSGVLTRPQHPGASNPSTSPVSPDQKHFGHMYGIHQESGSQPPNSLLEMGPNGKQFLNQPLKPPNPQDVETPEQWTPNSVESNIGHQAWGYMKPEGQFSYPSGHQVDYGQSLNQPYSGQLTPNNVYNQAWKPNVLSSVLQTGPLSQANSGTQLKPVAGSVAAKPPSSNSFMRHPWSSRKPGISGGQVDYYKPALPSSHTSSTNQRGIPGTGIHEYNIRYQTSGQLGQEWQSSYSNPEKPSSPKPHSSQLETNMGPQTQPQNVPGVYPYFRPQSSWLQIRPQKLGTQTTAQEQNPSQFVQKQQAHHSGSNGGHQVWNSHGWPRHPAKPSKEPAPPQQPPAGPGSSFQREHHRTPAKEPTSGGRPNADNGFRYPNFHAQPQNMKPPHIQDPPPGSDGQHTPSHMGQGLAKFYRLPSRLLPQSVLSAAKVEYPFRSHSQNKPVQVQQGPKYTTWD